MIKKIGLIILAGPLIALCLVVIIAHVVTYLVYSLLNILTDVILWLIDRMIERLGEYAK